MASSISFCSNCSCKPCCSTEKLFPALASCSRFRPFIERACLFSLAKKIQQNQSHLPPSQKQSTNSVKMIIFILPHSLLYLHTMDNTQFCPSTKNICPSFLPVDLLFFCQFSPLPTNRPCRTKKTLFLVDGRCQNVIILLIKVNLPIKRQWAVPSEKQGRHYILGRLIYGKKSI